MKTLLLLLLTFILYGCSESRTISKGSDAFTTLEQKIGLLKKYVNLNGKNFKTLDYHIIYQDNSTGMVPGVISLALYLSAAHKFSIFIA